MESRDFRIDIYFSDHPSTITTDGMFARVEGRSEAQPTFDPRSGWLAQNAMKISSLLIPLLTDLYIFGDPLVRLFTMRALLRSLHYSSSGVLKTALNDVPLSSFLAGVLPFKEDPDIVQCALYATEILIDKIPQIYISSLEREGVFEVLKGVFRTNNSFRHTCE
jgi:E3 ubiquitin-protein ligase TRIP12